MSRNRGIESHAVLPSKDAAATGEGALHMGTCFKRFQKFDPMMTEWPRVEGRVQLVINTPYIKGRLMTKQRVTSQAALPNFVSGSQ